MRRIFAIGAAKPPCLPAYQVKLDILEGMDTVQPNDLVLIGKDERNFHAWTKIENDSSFVGNTVVGCISLLLEGGVEANPVFARRVP